MTRTNGSKQWKSPHHPVAATGIAVRGEADAGDGEAPSHSMVPRGCAN
jgi:hypothetical protein